MGRIVKQYHYNDEQVEIAKSLGYETPQDAMIGLYNSGLSQGQIGLKFDVTKACICRRMKVLGIKGRGKGGPNGKKIRLTRSQIKELMELNETREVLAERFNISNPTISKIRSGKCKVIIVDEKEVDCG